MTRSSGYHFQAAEPVVTQKTGARAFSPVLPISPLSPIWLVPLVGVLIGLWLTYWHYDTQGLLITITFDSAEGIETGRTPIKYLDVEMGKVEKVEIDKERRNRVRVTARMTPGAKDYLNGGTEFWVVRPRIGISGISGLRTLLSGSHIKMSSAMAGGKTKISFDGLEHPPLTPGSAPGLRIVLRAAEASAIEPGSPVYYRGIKVGAVETRQLSEKGRQVEFDAFINAPYHEFIDTNTRFWNAGGINVTVSSEGITVHSESLEALVLGGIAFSNPFPGGSAAGRDKVFPLYKTQIEAEIQPAESAEERLGYTLYFDESLRGLQVGAPVEYRGVKIGYVVDIHIQHDAGATSFQMPEMPVRIFLDPRIEELTITEVGEGLAFAVEKAGLRARLQTGNLFTGALFIELAQVPGATPARIGGESPYPVFPTVPSAFSKIIALVNKLEALQLEKLTDSASDFFQNTSAFVGTSAGSDVSLHELMGSMKSTLAGIDAIIGSPENERLPANLAGSLRQLQATLQSIEGLIQGNAAASPLSYEFSTALRELTHAARAIRALTETLEGKPEAILFGK